MNNNVTLTPKQLKILADYLVDFYEKDFSLGKTDAPHFDTIAIDGGLYKVGLIPSQDNSPNIMNIRISYKGKING